YLEQDISITKWVNAWKCSNKIKREAIELTKAINHYQDKGVDSWSIYQLSADNFNVFIRLINLIFLVKQLTKLHLMQLQDKLAIHNKKDLTIHGNDVQQLFPNNKPGPWIGQLINQLEKKVVLNELPNNKSELKEWIRCHPPEKN